MLVVGLSGGIGCGKTAVSDAFAALGATVVDTDEISRALTGPEAEGSRLIAAEFGPSMLEADGRLDRAAMRERVFNDPAARQRLEALLHPLIRQEAARQLQQADGPYALLVVPLLASSPHFQALCDRILVVDCEEAVQIERVVRRSGLTTEQVAAIIAAQSPREARLQIADDIIDNSAGLADLLPRVAALHQQYMALAHLRKTSE